MTKNSFVAEVTFNAYHHVSYVNLCISSIKMLFSPHFGHKNFPKKYKTVTLNQSLMPGIRHNFTKS